MLYLHKSIEQHVEPRAELGCRLQWIDQRLRGRQNVQDDTEWVLSLLRPFYELRENLNTAQEYIFRGLLSAQTILMYFNVEFVKIRLKSKSEKDRSIS